MHDWANMRLAVTAYQKAIALKPDFADAEVAMGVALQDLKRTEEAIASFRAGAGDQAGLRRGALQPGRCTGRTRKA